MSVWYTLEDAQSGATLTLPEGSHSEGGTYVLGGTDECTLNVTYNYGKPIAKAQQAAGYTPEGMISLLDGLTGEESARVLSELVAELGTEESPDYWEPTEGNARKALALLLLMAQAFPEGVWRANG